MGERKRKSKIEWRALRLRARGDYLRTFAAPDDDAAVKAACKLFELDEVEAKRLLVRQHK